MYNVQWGMQQFLPKTSLHLLLKIFALVCSQLENQGFFVSLLLSHPLHYPFQPYHWLQEYTVTCIDQDECMHTIQRVTEAIGWLNALSTHHFLVRNPCHFHPFQHTLLSTNNTFRQIQCICTVCYTIVSPFSRSV